MFLKIKPNMPNPNTKNRINIPNLPAWDFLPKSQIMKPRKIINPVKPIFNDHEANVASSMYSSFNQIVSDRHLRHRLRQIGNQIIGIFHAYRQPQQTFANA